MPDRPRLSIIIPVLNEAGCLDQCLAGLFAQTWVRRHCEVIISDGGSRDDSLAIAARHPCRIETGTSGRALQMNRGASAARGRLVLFLHADSALPGDFGERLQAEADWGFFRLRLDHAAAIYRIIEAAINLRSRVTRIAGGDQGLYFRREFFQALGGFPVIPLMEDIAICKKARKLAQPGMIESRIVTSGRRWQKNGIVKTILLMWSLRLAYWLGVSPQRLHRIYYPQRG